MIRHIRKSPATGKLHGSVFYLTGVIADRSFTLQEYGFSTFCSCDLDFDSMTFIYELDLYSIDIYRMCENELPRSRLSKFIVSRTYRRTDRQTLPKSYTTPLRGWSDTNTEKWVIQCISILAGMNVTDS